MKSKLFQRLFAIMVLVLTMLIFSQLIWLHQQMEQDKQAFKVKLENSLQSILNFHTLQGYSTSDPKKPHTTTITIEETEEESQPNSPKQLGSTEINTNKYIPNFSLHKALEAAFTDISLERKKIHLHIIDSLFLKSFAKRNFIESYNMQLLENGKTIDKIYSNENITLKPSQSNIHIAIALGTKEIYVFTANFKLSTLPFLRIMLISISISGIAVILVVIFMIYILLKLKQKANQLQWREQAVSGIVHDLKSPISFTYTFLDYLAGKEQSAPMQKQLSNASTNIAKLSNKIELILTLFRGKKRAIAMEYKAYPLAEKCGEILSELNLIYQEKQAICTINIPKNLNIKVDPLYFEMALHNLLDNAFKYSDAPAKINIITKSDKKELYIYIKDSGKGIPQKEQKKIFQEFYRSSNNTKGHGIGLSFSRQIVEAHKGKIKLESKIDEGSSFWIILPLKQ
ncbi:sensor histidine kinase KdpD [Ancylomarina sp. 16SWW S1-10-2]|uniref:sensor histidine kinase n=1 Tax=Ancylomarina sp. 16SWW S1-10-2 TaxID=2499681 RepID=UPI0012AD5F26|nr:HAMP domain-containing sensor histidine kinase [Ancylomarina sp. 16SWW S1-10-2]MRT93370.1 HAMP domain-containing histidine kinase [Ancylomarina sp. 16SWW S1-10-2]